MKTLKKYKGRTDRSIRREAARRRFASVEDVRAEVERCSRDVSDIAIDELAAIITNDPDEQECHVQRLHLMEKDLSDNSPDPIVTLWSRCVAMAWMEHFHSSTIFYRILGLRGGLLTESARELRLWRRDAFLALRRCIKTLAYVKRVDMSEIENSLNKYRIVG